MGTKHKNMVIVSLLLIVLIMAVAYAAFATNLQINGTANIASRWDVHIKSITPSVVATSTVVNEETVYTCSGSIKARVQDNYTAEFGAVLLFPSDTVTYTVVVENTGTIDAVVAPDGITFDDPMFGVADPSDAILFSYSGIAPGDILSSTSGSNTDTFTVTATYNPAITSQPSAEQLEKTVTMTLNYIQRA